MIFPPFICQNGPGSLPSHLALSLSTWVLSSSELTGNSSQNPAYPFPFILCSKFCVRCSLPYFFPFAVMGSDFGSLTQTSFSGFPPPFSSVFLSAWQIATYSLRIISPSCTFPTLVSKLLKRLMSTGAWIVALDICHRANAKCMACVQYQKAKCCSMVGRRKCFLYSV